jgi:hypothetical protein
MKQFEFAGKTYDYRRDDLQCQLGERCVEVPIILDLLSAYKGRNILEVGNVLRKYEHSLNHTVIDRHEQGDCLNIDVIEYVPEEKPDLIVSVSTIEHIGYDMGEEDNPDKLIQFFEWVEKTLPIGGELLFTFPIGYNPFLDFIVKDKEKIGKMFLTRKQAIRRVSDDNRWEQSLIDWDAKYDYPFEYGNLVFIGVLSK